MNADLNAKNNRFFDSLDKLGLHAGVRHTLLSLCGAPKMQYYASTTPPKHSAATLEHFQYRMNCSFARLVNLEIAGDRHDTVFDRAVVDVEMINSTNGGDLPDYVAHAAQLYHNTYEMAMSNKAFPETQKLTNSKTSLSSESSCDTLWTMFRQPASQEGLTSKEYRIALAVKCNTIPLDVYDGEPRRCVCGQRVANAQELITHALDCPKFAEIPTATRHQWVKCAMAKIATRYGIPTHVEPSNHGQHNYSDTAVHHRPDILFYTNPTPVATDLTIVKPSSLGAGFSASNAADNKIRHHQDAVARQLHIFIPFAMETTGCYDRRCKELVRRLANDVPKQHRVLRSTASSSASSPPRSPSTVPTQSSTRATPPSCTTVWSRGTAE